MLSTGPFLKTMTGGTVWAVNGSNQETPCSSRNRMHSSPNTRVGKVGISLCIAAVLLAVNATSRAADSSSSSDERLNARAMDQFRVKPNADYQVAPQYRRLVPAPAQAPSIDAAAQEPPLLAGQTLGSPSSLKTTTLQNARAAAELAQQPYSREILQAASAVALDPALVHAVVHVESGYRCKAVSPKGAIGLMQVMPDTGARYGIANLRSVKTNLKAGTLYLRDLMQMFSNRLDLVLAAYNAGEGAVQKYDYRIPPYRETQGYVRAVMAKYEEWRGAFLHAAPQAVAFASAGASPRAAAKGSC